MHDSWKNRAGSVSDTLSRLRSGMNVFVHGAAATPSTLLDELAAQPHLENVTLYHMHTEGGAPWTAPEAAGRFRDVSFFTGPPLREPIAAGRADFIPVFLSDVPGLISSGQIPLDAAILQLSPPDRHGYCSLGTSVDSARAAADHAPLLLAEINEQMPRTLGNSQVPFSRVAAFVHTDRPLHEHPLLPETPAIAAIGEHIAALVEDGAVLQAGIGAIPNAALVRLHNRLDLGIHTEMFSDGVIDLVASGAVTNRKKTVHPGRIVTSFVNGTRRLYDFVHDNPMVEFHPCDRTNDANLLRKLDRLTAINSALQVDLTGQVCADSLGHRIYSGIGGQMDFIRGAARSRGGKAIIALPATAKGGTLSRIGMELHAGSGVVTTRGHVHWVVTEYGAVNLHGLTLRQRAEALISIAHPDFRGELQKQCAAVRHFTFS
ncbi:MAG: acetyl-CoA hydrolase/transferase family protein [Verrucomicrobiales bacterium]|nr:acetyl-CoA hydrolase/transferase family protein [Verrucomicrobiales bacterium]